MTQGFQHQDASLGFALLKSSPTPQHGQKPEKLKALPARPPRSVEPRPGH
jgi:hypothetical protein